MTSNINNYNILRMAQLTESKIKQLEVAMNELNTKLNNLSHVDSQQNQKEVNDLKAIICEALTESTIELTLPELTSIINSYKSSQLVISLPITIKYSSDSLDPISNNTLTSLSFIDDTTLTITDFSNMFSVNNELTSLNLNGWIFSNDMTTEQKTNVTTNSMFSGCINLTSLSGRQDVLYYLIYNKNSGLLDPDNILHETGSDTITLTINNLVIKAMN